MKSRTIGEPYRKVKLTLFSWSRHIEYVKHFAHFCGAAMRKLINLEAVDRIWTDYGDEDVFYDSEFDGDEYFDDW